MTKFISTAVVFYLLVSLTGCGTKLFASPATNPVIEDKVGLWGKEPVGTLAVTADRRVVIVQLEPHAKFCAEPPPDVAENITSSLAATMKAQIEGQGGETSINRQLVKDIEALVNRTQGADLYRTGMYALCQQYVNDAGDKDWVKKHSEEVLKVARELILAELQLRAGGDEGSVATAAIRAQSASQSRSEAQE